jgi:hypothetical protein
MQAVATVRRPVGARALRSVPEPIGIGKATHASAHGRAHDTAREFAQNGKCYLESRVRRSISCHHNGKHVLPNTLTIGFLSTVHVHRMVLLNRI